MTRQITLAFLCLAVSFTFFTCNLMKPAVREPEPVAEESAAGDTGYEGYDYDSWNYDEGPETEPIPADPGYSGYD
jgi:hypothetical protein